MALVYHFHVFFQDWITNDVKFLVDDYKDQL